MRLFTLLHVWRTPSPGDDTKLVCSGALSVKPWFSGWAVRAFKKLKSTEVTTSPMLPPHTPFPFSGGRWFLHAGSRAGLNKSYKFQLNRFKGLGSSSPRWPKIAILHWLEVHIALTTCYTVMALLWFTTALFRFARWKLNQLISRLSILPEKNTRELRSTYTYR